MELRFSNFTKPSEPKFKRVADTLLYSLPLYLGAILALPIDETIKLWINFGVTMITITIKTLSKFTSNEDTN
jgi:hypothetical protein